MKKYDERRKAYKRRHPERWLVPLFWIVVWLVIAPLVWVSVF